MSESPCGRVPVAYIFAEEPSAKKPDPREGGEREPGVIGYRTAATMSGCTAGPFSLSSPRGELGGVLPDVSYAGLEGSALSPLSPREEEVCVVRIVGVVAFAQELVVPFLIVLFLALIFVGLLFFAVVGRAMRNPGQTGNDGEDEEGGRREREGEERGRDDDS